MPSFQMLVGHPGYGLQCQLHSANRDDLYPPILQGFPLRPFPRQEEFLGQCCNNVRPKFPFVYLKYRCNDCGASQVEDVAQDREPRSSVLTIRVCGKKNPIREPLPAPHPIRLIIRRNGPSRYSGGNTEDTTDVGYRGQDGNADICCANLDRTRKTGVGLVRPTER